MCEGARGRWESERLGFKQCLLAENLAQASKFLLFEVIVLGTKSSC